MSPAPAPRTRSTTRPSPAKPAARERRTLNLKPREAKPICPKMIFNAVEGFGKTSFAAFAPSPLILMAKGETGYDTLLGAGLVPAVPAELIETHEELLDILDQVIEQDLDIKTLVLDALGGFERLCHEHVCRRDFKGDWGDKGFASYQKGFDVSVTEWLKVIHRLDRIHAKGIAIVLLGHIKVRPFKNPIGPDFDRYTSDVHHKTWDVTAKWADTILFGNYFTVVDNVSSDGKKGKGIGLADRIVYSERRDAWDAKNRFNMDEQFELTSDPSESWGIVWDQITGTKE